MQQYEKPGERKSYERLKQTIGIFYEVSIVSQDCRTTINLPKNSTGRLIVTAVNVSEGSSASIQFQGDWSSSAKSAVKYCVTCSVCTSDSFVMLGGTLTIVLLMLTYPIQHLCGMLYIFRTV